MANWYATLDQFKAELGLPGTTQYDERLRSVLEATSRQIDSHCDRHFFAQTRTMLYTAQCPTELFVRDLLSVTSLKTDDSGNRTYGTTWATTDYDLDPYDAPYESPPRPYWRICTAPNGRFAFPTLARGVQVVQQVGFYQVLESLTTLGANALAGDATITLPTHKAEVGQTLLIGSEQLFVTDVEQDTIAAASVDRGVNGTTAAAHSQNDLVQVYTYPVINRACLLQGSRLKSRILAPLGVLGMPETGTSVWIGPIDAEARNLLAPFVRYSVG